MPLWQHLLWFALFLLTGGVLVTLGIWMERRALWREMRGILDEQSAWMRAQEALNREVISDMDELRMRDDIDSIAMQVRRVLGMRGVE